MDPAALPLPLLLPLLLPLHAAPSTRNARIHFPRFPVGPSSSPSASQPGTSALSSTAMDM